MASNDVEDEKRKKGEKKFQKSYFDVLGLCCSSEVPLIENLLKPLEGVKEVSVIVPSRTVIVVHDTLVISQLQIVKALNQARLEASVRVCGDQKHKKRWPSLYSLACGLLLLLSLLKYVYHPLKYLALGAVAAGIFPIIFKAVVSIQNFRLDINILMIIAVIGTVAMNDYLEAGTIVFLFSIAEWLETRASHKANAVMSSLMNLAPQKAVIAETGEVVDADEVKVNTIIAVKAGEVIPIDGVVVDGNCEVDEKTLTGESFPVAKQKDSTVWAGTINLNGYLSVKTTALAEDCVVAKMAKLVEEAQNSKTSTQRLIDKFAKYYTPAVVIISTLVAVIPIVLRVHNEKHWLHFALVVLVSACPCALVLSTPVATFCAYTKAATSGLLIKGGDHLETLAKIKVIAFDKTGTITKGEFAVTNFLSLSDDIDLNTLVYWVSSIENKSSHPLAAAVVDHGRSLSIEPKPEEVTEFNNFPGEGICGKIDGRVLYIGNKKIATRAGSETVPTLQGEIQRGKTTGYIYSGATPIGFFSLLDACRSGAQDAIRQLKSLGIKSAMLTGDTEASAMQAHEQLGNALELVHAELLPEDKVKIVSEFKKEGPTAMVGDGINDAPALATADIGISMGISGSALASETGNIILMSNDLRKIPEAIKLARKSRRKVIENIFLSVITKAAILGLAIGGHPIVWAAVLADVGTCLLVILNSMLLLRGGHKHGGKGCKSSSKQHDHKHGCGGTNDCGSDHHHHHQHEHKHQHQHHNHKNCCSDKTKQVSEPQKCGSQKCSSNFRPCPSNSGLSGSAAKHHDVVESHDHCKGSDEHNEQDQCHGGTNGGSSHQHNHNHHHHHHHHGGGGSHHHHHHQDLHLHQHHSHKHSCSEKTKQASEPQKCGSQICSSKSQPCPSIPGGSIKHDDAVENHEQCKGSDEVYEPDHCHHGRRNKIEDRVQKHDTEHRCCSDSCNVIPKNAEHNAAVDGDCLGHKSHGTEHCHMNRGCENPKDHHESIHKSGSNNHEIQHHQHSGSHSDHQNYGTDEITVEISNEQEGKENSSSSCCSNVCSDTCGEVLPVECDCESSLNERQVISSCCSRDDGDGDKWSSKEPRIVHACINLDKRGVGGCCKSYMKECCVKHGGHVGAGFVGGLSEIITE